MKLSPEALVALEFDAVRAALARRCNTPPGVSRAEALLPFDGVREAEEALAETAEAREWLSEEGRIGIGLGADPRPPLVQLGIAGIRLAPLEILALVRLCRAAGAARRALAGRKDRFPLLARQAEALPDLLPLADLIDPHIGPAGEIADSASAELRRLRRRSASVVFRVREILERLLRSAGEALSDQFITERNGRHVLPVRADSAHARRGIVHGVSSSGATVFLEPLETIELNNELVAIRDQEAAEIERILQEWTARLAGRREDLSAACEAIGRLDVVFARGELARAMRAVRPALVATGGLRLREGRHPVLEETLARLGREVVPLSLSLSPDERTLVISGPNTGGKTVALKTLGLLAVMAHCGLHVPAAELTLAPLRQVQVDIGDRQSIAESLSTFSAHVETLARMLRELETPCLVLLDEVGTGTDPAEGVALATALLEALMSRGAISIVTTHHGGLKAWAYSTAGVGNAAVEFDEENLRPTYRLLEGVAGASSGLTIAERLGLDRRVVESARARVSAETRQSEELLARLRQLLAGAESDRAEAARLRAELDAERRAFQQASESDERRRREDLSRQAARVLEEFHRKAASLLGGLAERREAVKLDRERARREGELRREVAARLQEMGIGVAGDTGRVPAGPPAPGTRVRIASLGKDGVVEEADGEGAFVRVGSARIRVRLEDCRLRDEEQRSASPLAGLPAGVTASVLERDDTPGELFLLGNTVDEALEKLDKFLDDAFLAGRTEVRIVHGHGTGRLRTAVRQFLSSHRQIDSHRPGMDAEGGSGATVARLKH